jgi:Glycosyl hydrolase family 79 C-terminal beta domain
MNRRTFLVNGTLTGVGAALAGRSALSQTVVVTIGGTRGTTPIPGNFMGLGYEISSVARPGLLSPTNQHYVQLVRTLGTQGVIRVGGNTADYATYGPQAAVVSSPYKSVVNDAVLGQLRGFLRAIGWQLIWTLNLGSGSVEDAIAEVRAIQYIAGDQLLAFEIGNEPDIFPGERHRPRGYGYDDWLSEYRRYKTVLRAQFPRIPFAGPDAADKTEWVTRFAADEGKDCVVLTHHYYREGQNPGSTIQKLLGVDPKLQHQLDQLRAASLSAGVPYRISEVNSFSGGGRPGVSDTMAAALWALDYLFTLASNGCCGVNMETGVNQHNFISSYSPIGDDEQGHYEARPEYYGLLAFSLCGRGALLEVAVEGVPSIKAYATKRSDNTLAICLINKGATDADLEVKVAMDGKSSAVRLAAPALDATTGITLGGAQVTSMGTWEPTQREDVSLRHGQMKIHVPAASAALVDVMGEAARGFAK